MKSEPSVVFFDIESHNAGKQWDMEPREFFRLGQWAVGHGDVNITSDYDEFMEVINSADFLVGHNIINFDLTALYGKDSDVPLRLAAEGKVFDTILMANLVRPAPMGFYKNREGKKIFPSADPVGYVMRWLSLDNLCFQEGIPGKFGSLKELAKKYNPPKTKIGDLDYSLIPLDDEDFVAYARQDIEAVRELYDVLSARTTQQNLWAYTKREMLICSIDAQMTRNGFTVDIPAAEARVAHLKEEHDRVMAWLVKEYDFPTEGKKPIASARGKEVILDVLASFGITPESRPDWEKTATGNISLGGKEVKRLTEGQGKDAEAFGQAIATLAGQRALAELALDCVHRDGKVHHDITRFQRSGRTSVSSPGLTIWSARGANAVEKSYFIASPGRKLLEVDLSNADARIVAAYSGDEKFAERFEPGADGHEINGRLVFGDDVYDSDPKHFRQASKACVAEGTMILTDVGEVPIEDVTTDMRVWDGEEFVTHEGIVYNGVKEVITYDGLTATPDHIVFTSDDLEVSFGFAAEHGLRLKKSSANRN